MKKRNFLATVMVMVFVLILTTMQVYAAQPKVSGKYLDDFERTNLSVSNDKLSDGTTMYWNQSGQGTFTISGGVLNAKMDQGGFYRFATNDSDSFKYVVIRIKGDSNAANDKIYARMGVAEKGDIDDNAARGDKSFAQLLGPDGKPLPAVTSDWQDIVIDMAKNGFSFGGGSDAFQIGTWQAMNLDIDYIFMTNTNPNAASGAKPVPAQKAANASTDAGTANPKTGDSTPITAGVAVVLISAALLVVLSRKKASC